MDFELPPPEVIWDRTAAASGVAPCTHGEVPVHDRDRFSAKVCRGRLIDEDGSGNWYALAQPSPDRAVLFGWDESHRLDEDHDAWSSAPDWVRAIDTSIDDYRIIGRRASFVRWWDAKLWHPASSHPASPDLPDDGLFMRLQPISNPMWHNRYGPAVDRPTAVAAAHGFEPDEPDARYRRIAVQSATVREAVTVFIEIDEEGYETRRIEHFIDGRVGCGESCASSELTEVADDPFDAPEHICQQPSVEVVAITPEEFQIEWIHACGAD
ncbi:DUF6881 domain-containing protein [Nocardia aurea]|uniref:DUF6881 domain-containing protein n=1 Tax=Nocardia aurea TaxID=2144174 RepID=UPI0033B97CDB